MKRWGSFAAIAIVSVAATLATVMSIGYFRAGSSQAPVASTTAASAIQPLRESASTGDAEDFRALYESVRPSIVEIDITGQAGRRRFQQIRGQGSGVVIDASGHILTNAHVVSGAQVVTVIFADSTTASATVVSTDAANDLAVIVTDAKASELHPATLGDSGALGVGDLVAAVGNPFGLSGSLSTGVISGLDRTLTGAGGLSDQGGLLQVDAAINEGSSGGGLFDVQGELVGITSALENPDATTFAGVGFAVPINTAKPMLHSSR